MINVNQITAQLARMPDQALQQYAMMNKNDPYTVSLALSESNRRKQMRDAAQGQQGMAPQPKVVDQGIAGMAAQAPQPQMPQAQAPQAQAMPEDVGIGALPAPNMQGMADGGIVAFGDGGDVQHFQSGGSAFERWLRSNTTPAEQKRFESLQEQAEVNRVVAPPESLLAETARNRQLVADQGFTRGDVRFPAGLTSDTTPVPKVEIPPVGSASAAPAVARAPAAAAPAGLTYLEQLAKTKKAMGPDVNPEQAAMEKLVAERNTGSTEAKKELEADIASRADQFKGREERISKREAELGKQKESGTGLALLEAGLAMMQSKGRGLAGIAEGAGVGLKQYTSGLKDLKLAQEKLDEARDRTDELKQNQSMMDKREVRAANKDIRDASLSGQQYLIDARMKTHGESRADARAAVVSDITSQQAALDRQSRERIANMPSAQIQMINKLGNGNFAKGYEIYKQEAAIPRLYEAYTKQASDPLKGAEFQAKYPTFEVFRAGMGGDTSSGIIDIPTPAAGAVRPR